MKNRADEPQKPLPAVQRNREKENEEQKSGEGGNKSESHLTCDAAKKCIGSCQIIAIYKESRREN